MPQQTKTPNDQFSDHRFDDDQLDPFQRESDAIFNHPDMQDLDKRGDEIIRNHEQSNPAALQNNIKQAENQEKQDSGFYRPDNGTPAKGGPRGKIRAFLTNRKTLVGLGGGGAAATVIAIALLTPFLANINLEKVVSQWADKFTTHAHLLRASKVYKTKYFSNPDDCGKIAVRCKLRSGIDDKDLKKLRDAGMTIDDKDVLESKSGKKYVKAMSYTDDTGKLVRVEADGFVKAFRTQPNFLAPFEKIASMRSIIWRGPQGLKKFALFKVQRKSPIGDGKTDQENAKNFRATEYGDGDSSTAKATGGTDDEGNEDPKQKSGVESFNDKIAEESGELREQALKDGPDPNSVSLTGDLDTADPKVLADVAKKSVGSGVKSALTGPLALIDSYCSIYQMVRIVSFGAKLYQARALIKYAGIFMTEANQTMVGDGSVARNAFIGTILTSGSTVAASLGKTAFDSDGYTLATQGKVASSAGFARFTNGTPQLKALDKVKSILSTGGVSAGTCSKVKAWYGQVGILAIGIVTDVLSGGSTAIAGTAAGATVGVVLGVLTAYLTPKLIQYAAGVIAPDPVTDPERGYAAGNAIVAGMGAFGSQIGRSSGMRYVKKSEFSGLNKLASDSSQVIAQADDINDPSSATSDMESNLASALYPLANSIRSFNVTSFFSTALSLPSTALTKVTSADDSVDNYRGEFCADEDYNKLGLATDAFCNPIMSQSNEEIDAAKYSPDAVLDYMLNNNFIDDDGIAQGEYSDFLDNCVDGDEPVTADGYNADLSSTSSKDCTSSDDKFEYFRFYTMDNNILDSQALGVEGKLGISPSGGTAGGVRAMSYNILGASHGNDGGQSVDTRLGYAVSVIKDEAPDIIGFQEVSGQRKKLYDALKDTYDAFPLDSTTTDDPDGEKDGASRPIYWNKSEYTQEAAGTFEADRYHTKNARFPWVKLKHKSTGTEIYVYNIHTSAQHYENTPGYTPEEARAMETRKMVESIKKEVPAGTPVITTGDYNSTCDGDKDSPCTILENAGFKDSGEEANKIGATENYEYNTSHGSAGAKIGKKATEGRHIDHVFYNEGTTVTSWKTVVTEAAKNASDHTPVIVGLSVPGIGNASSDAGAGTVTASGFAWPLSEAHWKKNKADYLGGHTLISGTAWGEDSFGTSYEAGKGIASDISSVSLKMPVYAMYGGTVTSTNLCGANDGIVIKSTVNSKTFAISYMHGTNKEFKVGDTVKAGEQIMKVGAIGCKVYGVHLHIGMEYDSNYICPQDIFLAMDKGDSVNLSALTKKATKGCNGRD